MNFPYKELFARLHGDRAAYYGRWYHDRPIAITSARRDELRELHRVLYKCIAFMAEHYREFVPRFMPLSEKEMDILDMQSRYPFRAGTYRPDYLVSDRGELLLCEITSRFFAHGIFMSYFSDCAAEKFLRAAASEEAAPEGTEPAGTALRGAASDGTEPGGAAPHETEPTGAVPHQTEPGGAVLHGPAPEEAATDETEPAGADIEKELYFLDSSFNQMLRYMLQITGEKKDIYVLKSADKTSEIALYRPFYEACGRRVEIFEAEEAEENIGRLKDGFVISALNQKDLLSFSAKTIEAMIEAGMYNDLRTILIIHDKRFMSLWFEDAFTDRCLTAQETAFLRGHAIPTYLYGDREEIWDDARQNREGYILKHHRLGKSEKVYAGVLTDSGDWEDLWKKGDVRDMILQPFIRQKKYPTVWEGTPFEDYVCGMMLCADDRYFDSGMFRASSLPVTNKGDDRKICPVHTDSPALLKKADIL